MENVNIVMQAISTVGFPIAMCCGLLWYCYKVAQTHKEETEKFTSALNSNTLVMQKLCDKLGVDLDLNK